MTTPPPSVKCEQFHATLRVTDLTTSLQFYVEKLGFRHGFTYGDPPSLIGVNIGDVQIHLKQGNPQPSAAEMYFVVDDVDGLYRFQVANGVSVARPLADEVWGMREYSVHDLDGYRLGFGRHLPSAGPKIEVEREDLPVRLEKRLAALVRDLAGHKNMTVGECFEEIILHSFEKLPSGGLASPHTEATLAHIEKLKKMHGIEYEAHDAYRFIDKP